VTRSLNAALAALVVIATAGCSAVAPTVTPSVTPSTTTPPSSGGGPGSAQADAPPSNAMGPDRASPAETTVATTITTANTATEPPAESPAPEVPAVPTRNPALDSELIDAAWANDVESARRLIASGADVNAKDETEQSAYLIATSEGFADLLELSLASGADLTSLDSYRGTGLIRAAERGHAGIVGRLLRAGIAVDHVNRLGWTALDEAIVYGDGGPTYQDTVRALVAGGADVQRAAGDGGTPVEHAREGGHDVLAATLESAVAARSTDVGAATALLLSAASSGDADQVAIALRSGAPIESRDDRGRHCCWPLPPIASTSPGCWSHSAPIRTHRMTSRTAHGWSPESPAAWQCSRCCCLRARIWPCATGSAGCR